MSVPGVAVQPIRNGKALVYEPRKITLLDFASEQPKKTFTFSSESLITSAALSDNGRMAAIGCEDAICLWDTSTGLPVRTLAGQGGATYSVRFRPDGRLIVTSAADLSVWSTSNGKQVRSFGHKRDEISTYKSAPRIHAFSADGRAFVVHEMWYKPMPRYANISGQACGAAVYSIYGKKLLQTTGRWPIVSGDRKRLLVPDKSGGKFIVYDFSTGQKDAEIPASVSWPLTSNRSLVVAPGGNVVAQVQLPVPAQCRKTESPVLRFWDTTTAKLIQEIPLSGTEWACAALSGDGKTVAVQDGRRVRIIDAETGRTLLEMQGSGAAGGTGQVVFSPDGSKSAVRFGSAVAVVSLTPLRS